MTDQPFPPFPQAQPGQPFQPGQPYQQFSSFQQPVPYAYPPGATIPVDASVHADVQNRLQTASPKKWSAAPAYAYVLQRFPAWQVYPVKVGRWRLKARASGLGSIGNFDGGALSALLLVLCFAYYLLYLVVWLVAAPAKWVKAPDVVQILDPATGRPIAEHLIDSQRGVGTLASLTESSTVVFLGDPRVCGVLGLTTPQGQVYVAGMAMNREGRWRVNFRKKFTPEYIEQNAVRLMNTPYKEYGTYHCGPWLQDSPEAPQGGGTRWTRSKVQGSEV